MDSDKGRDVKAHYLSVARQMRAYSSALHRQWCETVDTRLITLLRRTLLVVPCRSATSNTTAPCSEVALGSTELYTVAQLRGGRGRQGFNFIYLMNLSASIQS